MTTKFGLQNHFDIIRTPYTDKEYVLLAEEPKKKWETELPYYDFYRRTGWIQEVREGNLPNWSYRSSCVVA